MADFCIGEQGTARLKDLGQKNVDLHERELTRVLRLRQVVPRQNDFQNELKLLGQRAELLLIKVNLHDDVLEP